MAKQHVAEQETLGEAMNKTEFFFEKNGRMLSYVFLGLLVLGETSVDSHVSFLVVNTEYACEVALVAFEGNYCGVEDGVAGGKQVAGNDRVSVVTPDNVLAALGSVLPGHVRNALTKDF